MHFCNWHVEEIRKEADSDIHILFRLDQQFESLLKREEHLKAAW